MSIGRQIRLNRLFAHPSGRLCSVAVDHFIGYSPETVPEGLRDIAQTLELIVAGRPDAVTMERGILANAWTPHAGVVPAILQSTICRPDDTCHEQIAEPEDAVRMGADAIAVAGYVRGATESLYLNNIAKVVKAAARYDLPVITHIYPRVFEGGTRISFVPEHVAWAARCALEVGSDVIKVPYCNDAAAYGQIVRESPVPVVAAGGPRTETLLDALRMFEAIVKSGARGATIGRNIWGFPRVTGNLIAIKAVIHDGASPEDAVKIAGLA